MPLTGKNSAVLYLSCNPEVLHTAAYQSTEDVPENNQCFPVAF